MGRPILRDGLEVFHDWMRTTERCSPTTAREYTSHVRRVVRALGDTVSDQDAVNAYFAEAYENDRSYGKLRSAWTVFAEWNLAEGDVEIPMPVPIPVMRARAKVVRERNPLPPVVRSALRSLKASHVPVLHMARIRWSDVHLGDLGQGRVHVDVPGEKNTYWLCEEGAVRALWDYAQVEGDLTKPLVPREPGADQPYPYSGLRHEISQYEPGELEAVFEAGAGSALGAAGPIFKPVLVKGTGPTEEEVKNLPQRSTAQLLQDLEKEEQTAEEIPANEEEAPESLADALGYDPEAVD